MHSALCLKQCLIISLLLLAGSACKPSSLPFKELTGYIVGPTNDIKPLTAENIDKVSKKHLAAAVLLTTVVGENKQKFCSGTLIGPEAEGKPFRILTNHHCFATEDEIADKLAKQISLTAEDDERCEKYTKVIFGYIKGQTENREIKKCQLGTMRFDLEGDLALFTLDENPSSRFVPAEFYPEKEIESGRKVHIVHHPSIDDKTSSDLALESTLGFKLPVAQISVENCITQGVFTADEWYLDPALKVGIKHTCDQKKGSSGSGLWDVETDQLLGVNWGGISLNYNNPTRVEIFNVASSARYVKAFVEKNTDEMAKIRRQQEQKSMDAERTEQEVSQSKSSGASKKNGHFKSCGVISLGRVGSGGGFGWVFLMTPLFMAFWWRRCR